MLYPVALKCGIGVFEFWDYTYGEIIDLITLYREKTEAKQKEQIASNYQVAFFTAIFSNRTQAGKQPPSLHEIFPSLFEAELSEEEQAENAMIRMKEQMLDFAKSHNQQRG